jgi:hypothetical protein
VIIAPLASVEIVGCDDSQIIPAFGHYSGHQTPCVRFAVIYESEFSVNVLFVNRNRIVQKRLLCLFTFDVVRANLAEVFPVPFEHSSISLYMQCITLKTDRSRKWVRGGSTEEVRW